MHRLFVVLCCVACAACHQPATDPHDVTLVDVATSSAQEGWAVNYPKQRKLLFMAGRLWLFYSDGIEMRVRSTIDGRSLTAPLTVRAGMVFGHRCAFAFDGTFVHYACCDALPGSDIFYRRGRPSADGTIAWATDEQVAFAVPDQQSVLYPKIVVDVAGRVWVAWMLFEGGFMVAPQTARVTRSSRTDGTFVAADGFPFTLSPPSTDTYPDPLGVALGSDATYWIYDPDGSSTYRGRPWTASGGWGPEEEITTTKQSYALFDAVAEGDVVHLSFGDGTNRYRRRDADGHWGDESVVGYGSGHSSIALRGEGHAVVTWLDLDGNRVLEREVWEGGMGPALILVDGGSDGLAGTRLGINLNGIAAAAGGFRSAAMTTLGTQSPFRVVLATR
jgi:hypothetical protein